MELEVSRVLVSEEEIQRRVCELAEDIQNHFNGEEIVMIGVLKGACVFVSDLMRKIKSPVILDFMAVSSYGMSTDSSGVVKIIKDLEMDIEGKNVLIVEDIIDTGLTLNYLRDYLLRRNCKDLKICTLLDKPQRRKCDVKSDFTGFEIPDEFVVGYGIDCKELYRNLPYVSFVQTK